MVDATIPEERPIVTYDEARAKGLKKYFTGEKCVNGHIAERQVSNRGCCICLADRDKAFREANRDKTKAKEERYRQVNREKILERRRKGRGLPCKHCGKPIEFPEMKPGAIRISRPRFCSDYCRLYSKVDKVPGHGPWGDCWPYTGAKHKFGHGMINRSECKDSDIRTAHSMSWEIANGCDVPEGMEVLHRCDFPPCCNPDHLFPGTNQDNIDDKLAKGRQQKGEEVKTSVLTEVDVIHIRNSSLSDRELADRYGVAPQTIANARSRKTWKHVR